MPKKNQPGKSSVHWMPFHLFRVPIGFCPGEKAWNKCMKKYGIKEPYEVTKDANCNFLESTKSKFRPFILITLKGARKHTLDEIHGLLVHEAVHAFDHICRDAGEHEPSSELKAYYIQDISQCMFEFYSRCFGAPKP